MKGQFLPKRVAALQERVCGVAAGWMHSLAVTKFGGLYSWGYSGEGQLGHGDTESQFLPKRVEALQERACSVAAGQMHSLAVTQSGALYSWGYGSFGQLGHGDKENQLLPKRVEGLQERVCSVAAGESHSLAVTQTSALYAWGGGVFGKLGHGDIDDQLLPTRVEALQGVCCVAAAERHTVAILENNTAHGWGIGHDETWPGPWARS